MTEISKIKLKDNVILKRILAIIFILIGVGVPLFFLPYEIYDCDEPFFVANAIHYKESPLASLSFALGHLWMVVFGESLLSIRVFSYIVKSLTIVIGAVYFYRSTQKLVVACAMFMILNILYCLNVFFDWNILSNLFLFLVLIYGIKYLKKQGNTPVILMGLFAACSILSRVTSASVLVVIIALIVCKEPTLKRKLVSLGIFTSTILISGVIICLIIYSSLTDYFNLWNPEHVISSHSNLYMYLHNIKVLAPTLIYTFLLGMTGLGVVCLIRKISGRSCIIICNTIVLAIITFVLYKLMRGYGQSLIGYYYAFYLVVVLMAFSNKRFRKNKNEKGGVVLAIIFSCLPMIGTNVIIYRFLVIPIIPIILSQIWDYDFRYLRGYAMLIGVSSVLAYVGFNLNCCRTYGVGPWHETKTMDKIPFMNGIKLSPSRYEKLINQYNFIEEYKEMFGDIMILGHYKYFYNIMNPEYVGYQLPRFQYNIPFEKDDIISEIKRLLPNYDAVSLMGWEWRNEEKNKNSIQKSVEKLLDDDTFVASDTLCVNGSDLDFNVVYIRK